MRTIVILFVITSILLCGFTAAAQEGDDPRGPGPATATEEAVEAQPAPIETAPKQQYREGDRLPDGTLVGTPEEEKPVLRGDLGQGGGNANPPNPPAQPTERVVERRTVVVRQLAAASQRGDQAAVKRLTTELGQLNERLAEVEANPLGGETGQRSMWRELHDAGVVSESYLREHYGLEPVSAPETEQDTMPARPAKGGAPMPLALQIVLGCIAVGAAVMAIIALASRGGNAVDVIDSLLADDRASGERRVVSGRVGNARFKQTTEPANATPVIPPAPAAAPAQPAFPAAPLGTAFVPVQVTANPVVLNPVQPAPAAPAQPAPPAAPAPAAPAPQAQPLQVYFNNNNLQGQGAAPAQPRQPQAPQGQQPAPAAQGAQPQQRQPRNQPAQRQQPRQQGGAQPPAPGAGAPPAQGGGQGNAPANP
jgi:hypothetical protein